VRNRDKSVRSVVLLMLLMLSALAGCWGKPKHPTLRVSGAQFKGVDLHLRPLQVRLNLDVEVTATNPNGFDLQVRRVRGHLLLAERHDLPLDLQPEVWLPAEQSATFTLPVSIPVEMVISLVKTSLRTECIPYKLEGSVDLTATSTFEIERDDHPLRKEGCLPRKNLLEAAAHLAP
jgi:hypothetical protein